jgi:ABC-2 type transport system ATP-binding protein
MVRGLSAEETAPTRYAWAIQAQGLSVRAGRRMAVDALDLALRTGVHGLLGPNGAGKTTLMRALATVGYLPQTFGFYPRFTLREFVEYMAWLKEVPGPDVPGAVQRAIERVELADRAGDRMKTLSGGMLRRAGIAQAIVNDPEILLLDEPTVGLDPEQRVAFRSLLRELGGDTCVLVSTHLVEDVVAACTDVVLIDSGRLVYQGIPADLQGYGGGPGAGDSPAERGYSTLLRQHRERLGGIR